MYVASGAIVSELLCEICGKNPAVTWKGLTNYCMDCCMSGRAYLHAWAEGIDVENAKKFGQSSELQGASSQNVPASGVAPSRAEVGAQVTLKRPEPDHWDKHCPQCGARFVEIRGRYPDDPRRKVCAQCLVERIEDLGRTACVAQAVSVAKITP